MPLNLEQHRSEPDVWQRTDEASGAWDLERWLAAMAAGGCLAGAYYSRRPRNLVLMLAGGLLASWAAAGLETRAIRRAQLRATMPRLRRRSDVINEASEESFPASDAPAFTSSTGNTVGTSRGAH